MVVFRGKLMKIHLMVCEGSTKVFAEIRLRFRI